MKTTLAPITASELETPRDPAGVNILARYDERVKHRGGVELAIVSRLIEMLKGEGYEVYADNGEEKPTKQDRDGMLETLFSVDCCSLIVDTGEVRGRVDLVFGNDGWDVVADYSMCIDDLITEFSDWVDVQMNLVE